MLSTRWTLVWQVSTRLHKLLKRWENVAHTVSTRWLVVFETLHACLEHASRWLMRTHIHFWTCSWFSHTIFTRSPHTSRCDCGLTKIKVAKKWVMVNIKAISPSIGISIIKIRWLWDHFIFIMGILTLLRWLLHIEVALFNNKNPICPACTGNPWCVCCK